MPLRPPIHLGQFICIHASVSMEIGGRLTDFPRTCLPTVVMELNVPFLYVEIYKSGLIAKLATKA